MAVEWANQCRKLGLTTRRGSGQGNVGHDHACDLGKGHDGYHVCFTCRGTFSDEPWRDGVGDRKGDESYAVEQARIINETGA